MIVSDTAIKNRTSVFVLALIILGIGIYSYKALPRESEPDITIPYVFVQTEYRGVSASDIETSITIKIEKKLKGLDKVKNISSVSSQGLSQINVEFLPGTDIDEVLTKVKDKVDEAKNDLPSDLENDPSVFEVNFSEMPIVIYSLAGTCGPRMLKEIADDLKDDIEAVPGILEAEVTGGQDREIRIEVDPDKLAYYRIPITSLQQAVVSENQNTSGGAITLGQGRYQLKVPGEFKTPEEILSLVVATHNGSPIYLKDVATVVDGIKEETSRSRLNGVDSVNIAVKKRAGENIIFIADKVDEIVKEAERYFPKNTTITKLMNKSKDIRLMVADLENNIISGLILVVIVLFIALGFRNALLVGIAIPFSMFLSFAVLHTMGYTLNMIVLFSLTLALGMLVDNAIVIVENVYRYMQQGVPKVEAAMKATSEVAWPVIGSTLTTLAAFFPMIFWPGVMGEFMKYLPITLIITLSSSLFVALVINPAMCAFFMKAKKAINGETLTAEDIEAQGEKPIEIKGMGLKLYSKLLNMALDHKITVLVGSFAVLILLVQVWLITIGIEKPVEFFPPIDPISVYVNIDPPEGADLDFIDKTVKKVEIAITGNQHMGYADAMKLQEHENADGTKFMAPGNINNIEHIYTKVVQNSGGSIFDSNLPNHIGIQFIDFEHRKSPTKDDLEELRNRVKHIAGVKITVDQQQEGPPTGPPINIEISGNNFGVLSKIAEKMKKVVENIPNVKDVRDDYQGDLPSVQVKIDRQKTALFGLTTSAIGNALKTAYNGLDVSTYYEGDDDYDIVVKLAHSDRQVADVLYKLMIPTPTGEIVPLTTLASIEYAGTLGDIVRKNHERVVTVKANVDEAKTTGTIARIQAQELLKQIPLPPGYKYKFTGEDESQKESEEFLSKAFIIALFLIFLILVTLFNSVVQPVIILTSVILSLGGAFWGLAVIKSPFGIIMTGVGIISLAGVVVNNAIVLIDYTNRLRENGMTLRDAVVSAGATRLRPVLLTAVTTILGLLPMVTGISYDFHVWTLSLASESSQWWRSMAIVVIFGLMIATILTLVVVPTLYALIENAKLNFSAGYTKTRAFFLGSDQTSTDPESILPG
ncbi:MAG: efflux RND transporter permease subunit [Proteobacteria bacterium]|nr:efflux RND transporter permease subunit [Pseudomonadota bacterium]MBU1584221.1 efflux RND transporter permease subunit [Pseudomonadota bacterium]MBU2455539.1 efflux RND transporter permease subunit [Pseudomonadota bacterium]MBU2631875.1 efflux RND transporter permease subunit [Pseudomonadota bacterium]